MTLQIKRLFEEFWGAIDKKDFRAAQQIMHLIKLLFEQEEYRRCGSDMNFVLKNILEKREALGYLANTAGACKTFFWMAFAFVTWSILERNERRITREHLRLLHQKAGPQWVFFAQRDLAAIAAGAAFLACAGDAAAAKMVVAELPNAPDPIMWSGPVGAAAAGSDGDGISPPEAAPEPESEPEPEDTPRRRMRM